MMMWSAILLFVAMLWDSSLILGMSMMLATLTVYEAIKE